MTIKNTLILDAARDKIFLTHIFDKNIYTCSHENSKINFEKIMILINNFLQKNKFSLCQISNIYVNRGPGSFAGIRNTLSVIKALSLTKNIDYYCFSLDEIEHSNIQNLCDFLEKDKASPIVQFTPEESDIDALIDVRAVFQEMHREFDISTVPSLLRPRKGNYNLIDYEKVYCSNINEKNNIFDLRGIDRFKGIAAT